MTAALVLCVAQIYALKGYYQTGEVRAYRSRLYASSVLQFFFFALIAASGGTLSPIGITIWAIYYLKNRRRVISEIRKIEAEQPGRVGQAQKLSSRLRNRINALNRWERAWFVLAVTWAVLVLAWSSLAAPQTPGQLNKERNALLGPGLDYPIGDPRRVAKAAQDGTKLTVVGNVEVRDEAKFEQLAKQIETYPHDLAVYIIKATAVWAFPLIVIYLFGLGIAWVRVGFSKNTTDSL